MNLQAGGPSPPTKQPYLSRWTVVIGLMAVIIGVPAALASSGDLLDGLLPSDSGEVTVPTFDPAVPATQATEQTAGPAEPTPQPTDPPTGETSNEPAETTTETTDPPTFLERIAGSWSLIDWRERPGQITLGMSIDGGTLTVDGVGHAVWRVTIDDGGPDPGFERAATCLGVIPVGEETLEAVTGRLVVDGDDLIGDRLNWQGNLTSLRGDANLAFCGQASPADQLFVYETTVSPYALTLAPSADGGEILAMENAAGTFTWRRNG